MTDAISPKPRNANLPCVSRCRAGCGHSIAQTITYQSYLHFRSSKQRTSIMGSDAFDADLLQRGEPTSSSANETFADPPTSTQAAFQTACRRTLPFASARTIWRARRVCPRRFPLQPRKEQPRTNSSSAPLIRKVSLIKSSPSSNPSKMNAKNSPLRTKNSSSNFTGHRRTFEKAGMRMRGSSEARCRTDWAT